jgi:hypothetical protein
MRRAHRMYRQSAAIGIISIDNRTSANAAYGAMVFERLWLTVTSRRLALQRMTGGIGLDLSSRAPDAAPPSADVFDLRRRVGAVIPNYLERMPIMCFRIGAAPPSRGLRRPVEDVFARVKEHR